MYSLRNCNIPSLQSFTINANEILCEGSSIYLQFWFISYDWNTGENTNVISVNSEGIYNVSAIDINGCIVEDEIEIISVNPIQVNIQTEMDSLVICKDTEFSFNISSSYVNAVWNNSFSVYLTVVLRLI